MVAVNCVFIVHVAVFVAHVAPVACFGFLAIVSASLQVVWNIDGHHL